MGDEPTLGELSRRIDGLDRRIDGKVDAQLYQIQHAALLQEIAELKAENVALRAERVRDGEKLATMRRWWIGTVIVPLVAVLLAYVLSKGGNG